MRVLIVEDQQTPNSALSQALTDAGFTVDRATDTRAAVSLTRAHDYNLMIADEVLRGIGGAVLVRHLRSTGNVMPALLLADSNVAIQQILAAGVDDVLLKSSTPTEHLDRVQALLRTFAYRPRSAPSRLFVADLVLDTGRRTSFRARRPLHLTPGEILTLELLMKRQGEIVSRTVIASCGLPASQRSTKAIDVHMSRLRYKVDGDMQRKLLHTVRGAGFVLEDRTYAGRDRRAQPLGRGTVKKPQTEEMHRTEFAGRLVARRRCV